MSCNKGSRLAAAEMATEATEGATAGISVEEAADAADAEMATEAA